MIANKIKRLVVKKDETIANAFWKFNKERKLSLVVDDEDKFLGVVGNTEYEYAKKMMAADEKIETLCNKHCKVIDCESDIDVYMAARNIYADYNLKYIPVINKHHDIIDLFSPERAFYKNYFTEGKLERMHYAVCIWAAAQEAKRLGHDAVSVIEFGVAGGNGLLEAQMHAREISRLLGIHIEVYGFDIGTGLPVIENAVENMGNIFKSGLFKMDQELLSMQLEDRTHLVLGNIEDTIRDFMEKYNAPVVGALFVDVDLYSSTKPILSWLEQKDEYFLPRVFMYFDDISALQEGMGEEKAIIEFNQTNNGRIRISPERVSDNIDWIGNGYLVKTSWLYDGKYAYAKARLKICHRYEHKDYIKWSYNEELENKIEMNYRL